MNRINMVGGSLMKITDFSKVAKQYDQNPFRLDELDVDQDLMNLISTNAELNVLDLSCGTGLYLEKQMSLLQTESIHWHGLDKSIDMLNQAQNRVSGVDLRLGSAEELPYNHESFDYIVNNYAFHHYCDKDKALDEIERVLKRFGIFKMHNISIHDMKEWWVYHYFPEAFNEDLKRFWTQNHLFNMLEDKGFKVEINTHYQMLKIKVKDYLFYAENRDISVLTLIHDEHYKKV